MVAAAPEEDGGRGAGAPSCGGRGWRGRPGRVVRSPKNSTSTPPPPMSRSDRRPTIWLARRARITAVPARSPRGTTVNPNDSRKRTNHSNSSGGSRGSTTTVSGKPWRTNQAPPTSHPPRWGMARIGPRPGGAGRLEVAESLDRQAGRDPVRVHRGQAQRLHPVPAVGGERPPHRPVEGALVERRRRRPPLVAGHHLPVARRGAPRPTPAPGPGAPPPAREGRWPPPTRPGTGSTAGAGGTAPSGRTSPPAGTAVAGGRRPAPGPAAGRRRGGLRPAAGRAAAGGVGTGPRAAPVPQRGRSWPRVAGPELTPGVHPRQRPATAARVGLGRAGRAAPAWRHTMANRWPAVKRVRASISHRIGTMRALNSRLAPRASMRSARSMSPPRAVKPSDSARARSYDTRLEAAMTARGSMAACPPSTEARYQAKPPSTTMSLTRSTTESKNAPRGDAVPGRLGHGPVEQVGDGGRGQQERAQPEPSVGDGQGGGDGDEQARRR